MDALIKVDIPTKRQSSRHHPEAVQSKSSSAEQAEEFKEGKENNDIDRAEQKKTALPQAEINGGDADGGQQDALKEIGKSQM
jgi:hypothetical protein